MKSACSSYSVAVAGSEAPAADGTAARAVRALAWRLSTERGAQSNNGASGSGSQGDDVVYAVS